jgi:hypothetical protein
LGGIDPTDLVPGGFDQPVGVRVAGQRLIRGDLGGERRRRLGRGRLVFHRRHDGVQSRALIGG